MVIFSGDISVVFFVETLRFSFGTFFWPRFTLQEHTLLTWSFWRHLCELSHCKKRCFRCFRLLELQFDYHLSNGSSLLFQIQTDSFFQRFNTVKLSRRGQTSHFLVSFWKSESSWKGYWLYLPNCLVFLI